MEEKRCDICGSVFPTFKGIKDTTVSLQSVAGASVFAFVGLNESGKTTILEAIHSFSPDDATSELLGGAKEVGVPFSERVPRHQLSNFTGDVSVKATLSVEDDEKELIKNLIADEHKLTLDVASFPSEVTFERRQRFENGDFQKSLFTLRADLRVKSSGQRKWRPPTPDEKAVIRDAVLARAFAAFMGALRQELGLGPARGVVAVDAKSLRRGYEKGRAHMPPLMMSVWDTQTRLAIAQGRAQATARSRRRSALLKGLVPRAAP